jgi:hypothetical protein
LRTKEGSTSASQTIDRDFASTSSRNQLGGQKIFQWDPGIFCDHKRKLVILLKHSFRQTLKASAKIRQDVPRSCETGVVTLPIVWHRDSCRILSRLGVVCRCKKYINIATAPHTVSSQLQYSYSHDYLDCPACRSVSELKIKLIASGIPIASIREVGENGTQLYIGDASMVEDLKEREQLRRESMTKAPGDPTIVWGFGGELPRAIRPKLPIRLNVVRVGKMCLLPRTTGKSRQFSNCDEVNSDE